MAAIKIIAGLWNPEPKYKHTRHNAGAEFVGQLATKFDTTLRLASHVRAHTGVANIAGERVRLMIPALSMNDSGYAVAAAAQYFKIEVESILVVYDELDVEVGKVRLKIGGGAGGHNGIKSVVSCLGTPEFWRLRLGIGRPAPHGKSSAQAVLKYVLNRANAREREAIAAAGERVMEQIEDIAAGRMTETMNMLHKPDGLADGASGD